MERKSSAGEKNSFGSERSNKNIDTTFMPYLAKQGSGEYYF